MIYYFMAFIKLKHQKRLQRAHILYIINRNTTITLTHIMQHPRCTPWILHMLMWAYTRLHTLIGSVLIPLLTLWSLSQWASTPAHSACEAHDPADCWGIKFQNVRNVCLLTLQSPYDIFTWFGIIYTILQITF